MPDPAAPWRILLDGRREREATLDQMATLAAQYFDGLRRIHLALDPKGGGRAPWPRRRRPLLANSLIAATLARGHRAVDGLIRLNQMVIGGIGGRISPPPGPVPDPPSLRRPRRLTARARLRSDQGAFRAATVVSNPSRSDLPVRLLTPALPSWLVRLRSEGAPDPLPGGTHGELAIVGHVRADTRPGRYELTVGLEPALQPARLVLEIEVVDS